LTSRSAVPVVTDEMLAVVPTAALSPAAFVTIN
jgi:hypothetical protein